MPLEGAQRHLSDLRRASVNVRRRKQIPSWHQAGNLRTLFVTPTFCRRPLLVVNPTFNVRFGSKADMCSALGNVRFVPCVDGSELARTFFTFAALVGAAMCSAFSAAHGAAGHNALRGSGPDQKHAFDNALAQVGCPDRRIDRLCITCCSPSQPSHHAGGPTRSRLRRKHDGFLVTFASGHHGPRPSAQSCWRVRWRRS